MVYIASRHRTESSQASYPRSGRKYDRKELWQFPAAGLDRSIGSFEGCFADVLSLVFRRIGRERRALPGVASGLSSGWKRPLEATWHQDRNGLEPLVIFWLRVLARAIYNPKRFALFKSPCRGLGTRPQLGAKAWRLKTFASQTMKYGWWYMIYPGSAFLFSCWHEIFFSYPQRRYARRARRPCAILAIIMVILIHPKPTADTSNAS
jgi:hypothetical protein